LIKIYEAIGKEEKYLNFFLSDGERLWVFRKGNTLFYHNTEEEGMLMVSSTVPEQAQGNWKPLPEEVITTLTSNNLIQFFPLFE